MTKAIGIILLVSLFTGLVAGVGVPTFMVGEMPTEFGFLTPSVFFVFSGVTALAVATMVALISVVATLVVGRRLGWALALFFLGWVVLSGFLFPLVLTAQMVDASQTSLNWFSLVLVAFVSIVIAWASVTRLAPAAYIALTIIAFGAVIPASPAFTSLLFHNDDISGVFEVSRDRNIFVIGFDGIPSNVASDVLENNPDLSEMFNDFVFFKNAISAAPGTRGSARSELFGHRKYSTLGRNEDEVHAKLDFDALPMNRIDNAYAHGVYSRYNTRGKGVPPNGSMSGSGIVQSVQEHEYWFGLIMARLFSGQVYEHFGLAKVVKIARNASAYFSYGGDVSARLDEYEGMEWKSNLLVSEGDYFGFVNNLRASKTGLSLRQMHFMHTHFPVDFDAECRFRGKEPGWHERSVNYEALYEQAICEFTQLGMLLDRLKSLGIYNDSLIVLKSDHGEPVRYFDVPPHNLQINGNRSWGFNRYQPLLMIKDVGAVRDAMAQNEDLVSLADLGRTICLAADIGDEHCAQFEGLNLLGDFDISESPDLFIEVPVDEESTSKFGTHLVVRLTRDGRSFVELLEDHPDVILSERESSVSNEHSSGEHSSIRIEHLTMIKESIESFYEDQKRYPESPRWSGLYSNWGPSLKDWVPGLVPDYIDELPRDPRDTNDGSQQYLYRSDGDDYKLIVHGVRGSCDEVKEGRPELVDPRRDCWAYGYWTEGARDW